jgi:hypothetical protein
LATHAAANPIASIVVFNSCHYAADGFQLEFIGDPARQYLFQVSEDMVAWRNLPNKPYTGGALRLNDPDAGTQSFAAAERFSSGDPCSIW